MRKLKTSLKLKYMPKAFSLIETLLYITLFSVVVVMIVGVYGLVIDVKAKDRVTFEVTSEGSRIMQIITQSLRNATLINSPPAGSNSAIVSVNVFNITNNPTMFYLTGDNIVMKEGGLAEVILNSNRTKISGLKFTNLSRAGTNGTIKIEFTVTAVSTNPKAPFQFSQSFASDATLKQ